MRKKILWKVNNKTLTKISLEEETGIYVMGGKHYLFLKKMLFLYLHCLWMLVVFTFMYYLSNLKNTNKLCKCF